MELQKVRDEKNVKYLLRKVSGSEQSQPKKEIMWAATSRATGAGLPKPFGAYILSQLGLGAGHKAIALHVYFAGVQSCFGLTPPYSFLLEGKCYFVLLNAGSA